MWQCCKPAHTREGAPGHTAGRSFAPPKASLLESRSLPACRSTGVIKEQRTGVIKKGWVTMQNKIWWQVRLEQQHCLPRWRDGRGRLEGGKKTHAIGNQKRALVLSGDGISADPKHRWTMGGCVSHQCFRMCQPQPLTVVILPPPSSTTKAPRRGRAIPRRPDPARGGCQWL